MKRERWFCSKCKTPFDVARSVPYCKPCWRAYHAERRKDPVHAQEAREATAKWRAGHHEEVLAKERAKRRADGAQPRAKHPEKTKAWREAHRAKKWWRDPEVAARNLAAQKARRERDPEAYYAQKRKHDEARYARDKEKRISASMAVRAKRAGAPGSHTIAEWKAVLRHHGRTCVYCNTKLTPKNVSRDHRQPLCRSGSNDIRNIVPACRSCNSKKHDKTFEEFRKVLQ
jgi:5-methylcytosine-specific restriction endonuclease McrA